MNYKRMNINDIIDWCKENNQTEWLKKEAAKEITIEKYPRVKGADGKMTIDKTQAPKKVKAKNTFINIKIAFCEKFMPEIMPKAKEKKKTMYDIINEL